MLNSPDHTALTASDTSTASAAGLSCGLCASEGPITSTAELLLEEQCITYCTLLCSCSCTRMCTTLPEGDCRVVAAVMCCNSLGVPDWTSRMEFKRCIQVIMCLQVSVPITTCGLAAVLHAVSSCCSTDPCVYDAGKKYISYLPLAHIYERVVTLACTYRAMSLGFFR